MLHTLRTAILTCGILIFSTGTVYAADCTITTTDVGVLHGSSSNGYDAVNAAREQCFDRMVSKYKSLHNVMIVDDEAGLAIIDHCANLSCDKAKK